MFFFQCGVVELEIEWTDLFCKDEYKSKTSIVRNVLKNASLVPP